MWCARLWVLALAIAVIVAMFCPQPDPVTLPGPYNSNQHRAKVFFLTFAAAYIVLYFASPASSSSATIIASATPALAVVGKVTPLQDALANIEVGDPSF